MDITDTYPECVYRIPLGIIDGSGAGDCAAHRCRLKVPDSCVWDDDIGSRWLAGGGSPLAFGHCSDECPRRDDRAVLMDDTVARPDNSGGWLLMNRQENGYSEFAYPFSSLAEIRGRFAVHIGPRGEDEHGTFVRILRARP